jgi:hypothetical protein
MLPEWRKATWALAIWNVLMILWLATAIGGVGEASCAGETGAARAVCEAGVNIGLSLGLSFVFTVWLIGIIAFGLIWLMSRPKDLRG